MNSSLTELVEKKCLVWDKVKNMPESESILVNVNKIYWKLSDGIQQGNIEQCRILENTISQIHNEKIRYIPMTVGHVKQCFGDSVKDLSIYTFVDMPQATD